MKRSVYALAFLLLAAVSASLAQDFQPIVENAPPDVSVPLGTEQTKVKFKNTFALQGVPGPVVRFSTSAGLIDVALLSDKAPNTVATFLKYALAPGNNGDPTGAAPVVYTYNNTLLQRAIPGFVVQGGGFFVDESGSINQILNRPEIPGEPGVSNIRGTLAMALSNGPDSGTGDFFFNVGDNDATSRANLDNASNGGPFTVFGRVIHGVETLDAITALPIRDFTSSLGQAFASVPLFGYDGATNPPPALTNLVYLHGIASLPLIASHNGMPASLKLKLKGNSNPALVTSAVFDGKKLTLRFAPDVTGSSTLTIFAKDSAKHKATTSFVVTVQ